jgi:hypothetical protein
MHDKLPIFTNQTNEDADGSREKIIEILPGTVAHRILGIDNVIESVNLCFVFE